MSSELETALSSLILSLFPGIGLLDMAFEEAGFCVVRGPDVLWGGDVKAFRPPPGRFDGVIGGPPCQAFSQLRHIVALNHKREPDKYHPAENLIPEFERVVGEAAPTWFLMENVPAAPGPVIAGYAVSSFILNNRWVEGATAQNRVRRFTFGVRGQQAVSLQPFIPFAALEPLEYEYAVCAAGSGAAAPVRQLSGGKPKSLPKSIGGARGVEEYERLQGLPAGFLQHAPFTVEGKRRVLGNGVPLPLGRAVAGAVLRALSRRAS